MMNRFGVFILLFLAAGFTWAQDMPPLPSDAPPSAATAKDDTMPALPDTSSVAATPVAAAAQTAANDMPALPDTGSPAATSAGSNDMPALPDANTSAAATVKFVENAVSASTITVPAPTPSNASASADNMPALPDASSSTTTAKAKVADGDMLALPDASGSAGPKAAASPTDSKMNTVAVGWESSAHKKAHHEIKPWNASKVRPKTIFGGWIRAKGGNITSKLSWTSQQVLNALDAKKYKMANEEGVYEGEQNKGPQYRKFTFNVPMSKDTVFVLLKQVKNRIWLRVGPDEEPAPANHTYAEVAKIRDEDLRVLKIIKAKLGYHLGPHFMVPSWSAPFNRRKETADE